MKLVFINMSSEEEAFFGLLQKQLSEKYPGIFEIVFYDAYDLNDSEALMDQCIQDAEEALMTFVDTHGGLPYFLGFHRLYETLKDRKPFFVRSGIENETDELLPHLGLTLFQYGNMEKYFQAGGLKNYLSLCVYSGKEFGGLSAEPEPPEFEKYQCLYTPEELLRGEAAERYLRDVKASGKIVIAVIIHEHLLKRKNMEVPEALYREIQKKGYFPLVLVTNILPPGTKLGYSFEEALAHYITPYADVVINTTGMSVSVLAFPGDGSDAREESIFEPVGLPVIQAMQTYYDREQWEKSLAGLDNMMLSCCVYQPEFDGQLIAFPICTRELVKTEYGTSHRFLPIEDRLEKVVTLAGNYGKLRHIPAKEKKVAIIFHNMPPRNDTIGCAFGLDTPETVFRLTEELKKEGVYLAHDFADGQEIIDEIIHGLSNDARWLSGEEMKKRSVDMIPGALYRSWFASFGEKVQKKLTEDWGEAPGEFMTVGGDILVPGIRNGNVFIGLQPPRALEEQAEAAYHSTDLVCPHQYLAYYQWIEKVFKADVILHVGTHGTIEWLPGKEIAMSKDCYPDLAIGCLPHLYIYNIAVTGEGMQAKRRTFAGLLGHLIPAMQQSGVYGELETVDDRISDYYRVKRDEPQKMPVLAEEIWELSEKMHLNEDIGFSEKPLPEEMEPFVEKLHLWIGRLKGSEVRDGLHIFGEAPKGEQLKELSRLLVRVPNGEVPSIRQALGSFYGLDVDAILDHPEAEDQDGVTGQMRLEALDEKVEEIFAALLEKDFTLEGMEEILAALGDGNQEPLRKCLTLVCREIVPNLRKTTEEMDAFRKGIHGKFISPGPSGNPSRGNAGILPTGRNFYSVDPGTIPSRAAWKIGQTLAEQMLEREQKEKGKLPESVAIVVYAGDTMKTRGDDLGEILYLWGIRPVWLGSTDRVIGLEVIPVEELGRPRIDVTLRISGLFRDTFPNLIERIEDAVNLVAALDETPEENYIRKHIREELEELLEEGYNREQAYERASARIFGCPPGTYGAGVDTLINSRQWDTVEDLGNTYIRWSGHAYGRKLHGEAWGEQLAKRLSKTTVTIKNEPSVELDMLDSDDFYVYHGGLIAAVRAASGEKPSSYSTSTADVAHIETLTVNEDTARIMRSRIQNPKWVEGLKRHGYKGAQEISSMVDIVFGWDATSDNISDWMYDGIMEQFLQNEENRSWMEEVNPWAVHQIAERLLEASQREMWNASEENLEELREIYQSTEGEIEEILE